VLYPTSRTPVAPKGDPHHSGEDPTHTHREKKKKREREKGVLLI
jgi:hypothetical protein